MRKHTKISLLCCISLGLTDSAISQEIKASEGDTIRVEARGKSDEATVPYIRQVKISDITIDYGPWKKKTAYLQLDRQDAQKNYERERKNYDLATDNIRKVLEAFHEATRAMNEKRLELNKAAQAAASPNVEEGRKTPEYKRIETRIGKIRERLATIDERIAYLRVNSGSGSGSATATLALLDENDRLEDELAGRIEQLTMLQEALGIDAEFAAAKARARQFEKEYLELQKASKRAETNLAVAEGRHELASKNYANASTEYEKAAESLSRLSEAGSPMVTGIKSLDFSAKIWAPEEELNQANASVKKLGRHLAMLDRLRKRYRSDFNDAVAETTWAAEDLNDAIYQSSISQWLIESGFFLYDVGKAASRGGPYAAGAKIIQKSIEIAVFPPSYYDATLSVSDAVLTTIAGIPKKSGKRLIKTGTTGHGAKLLVAQLMKEQGERGMEELWASFTRESWFDDAIRNADPELYSRMTEAIQKMVSDQSSQLEASEKAFATLLGKQGLSNLAKQVGKEFTKGLIKDLGKEALKKAAAEFFEGRAFLSYMKLQAYVSISSRRLLRATTMYWATRDLYDLQLALRDELVDQYDPDAHLKIVQNDRFIPEARYEFRLVDNDRDPFDPNDREISVKLGAVELERHEKTLIFLLPEGGADKLVKDQNGGVKLDITILQ